VKTRKRLRAHQSIQRVIIHMPPSAVTENCFWAMVCPALVAKTVTYQVPPICTSPSPS